MPSRVVELRRRAPRLSLALVLGGPPLIGSACDRADGPAEDHLDALPSLVAEADARIGSFDDPTVGFSRVGGVDVDREGNVYVLEAAVPEIRVYDPAGDLLRRIGRRGSGPGEFEGGVRFGVVGDTVWAVDVTVNRITLFDREGTVLSAARTDGLQVPLPSSYGFLLPWTMRPDGMFVSHFGRISFSRDGGPTGVRATDSIPVPFVLFDASGRVADTIGWADRPPPRMWRPPSERDAPPADVEVGGRRLFVPTPPTTLPWWEPLADGYVVVETPVAEDPAEGVITVTRFGLQGDTVYSRLLRYHPVPYSNDALDSIAIHAARGEPGGMVPYAPGRPPPDNWRGIARVLREAMRFPPFQLPIQYPWVARDGSVWLRRWDGTTPTAHWILLDPRGRPRGALKLPAEVRVMWSAGDVLWGVEPDEYEVPWLVRYRIRPAEARQARRW